ncbi:MAG: hypothetical protein Athens101428_567 [Candidatus Berkelbacteria bacterium Athens1014_28]|uniref:Uncharacterized protein n=1 Tax=Candidatus Berkelbacteria bacterium Athens1014_28 TaxID=2017145 RepID=A0A554LLI0_9BACT|nr:MAG: hypothetical protein Athens101428_567 [Candidatus Berkelbacteria bacterium Athens1014_28]
MSEETKSAEVAPAPAAPSGKKNNAVLIIIIIVVVLVILGIIGKVVVGYVARKAGEKLAEGIVSSVTGGKVDVDTGSGVSWPSDMPSSVPKYSKGKITMATKINEEGSKGWSVIISETSQSDYDSYKSQVVSAGWTNSSSTSFGAIIDIYENADYQLNLTFDSSSSGVSITVALKS